MKWHEIDWDKVVELIDPDSSGCEGGGYISHTVEISTDPTDMFRVDDNGDGWATIEAGFIPGATEEQGKALADLERTGVRPTMFEIADLDLDEFEDEAALAQHILELFHAA